MVSPNAQTKLYLLLGNPVDHSLSPALHNSAFRALGINSVYLASQVRDEMVEAALNAARALSLAGLNITSPHKEAVIPFLDQLSQEAKIAGSVNTIINDKGSLHGYTTDGKGLIKALAESAPDWNYGGKVLIVGAGGAARAVALSLAHKVTGEIHIFNRNFEKAKNLAGLLMNHTGLKSCIAHNLDREKIKPHLGENTLTVYCLPVDSDDYRAALQEMTGKLNPGLLFDLRYNEDKSSIRQEFQNCGGRAFDGSGMLLWQAAGAFELFTGKKAPLETMRKVLG